MPSTTRGMTRQIKVTETATWQPERTSDLISAIARLERDLPGWWWRVGACHVSADATIGPDRIGPAAHLLQLRGFDEGFDCDIRQPASVAEALNGAIDMALLAIAETKRRR